MEIHKGVIFNRLKIKLCFEFLFSKLQNLEKETFIIIVLLMTIIYI
jgi:hypothetical protein